MSSSPPPTLQAERGTNGASILGRLGASAGSELGLEVANPLLDGGILGLLGPEGGPEGGNLLLERGVLDLLGLDGGSNLGRLGLDGSIELGLEFGRLALGLCPDLIRALYAAITSTLNILQIFLQISEGLPCRIPLGEETTAIGLRRIPLLAETTAIVLRRISFPADAAEVLAETIDFGLTHSP